MGIELVFSIFVLCSVSIAPFSYAASVDTFVFGGCSRVKYTPNSPFESNINSLLTSLVNSATYSSYNNFTIMASAPTDLLYGLYQCRGDLSMPDCAMCVARAVSQLGVLCSQTCGAALQLQGCFVKYDNDTFLGLEDKTVVLKKCGPSVGYQTDTMSRRDAVLAGLAGAGGLFRIGGSGDVQGVGQCVGDLSLNECQDCMSEAIGRLKGECGAAVFGDMYLAKCYARYTTGGSNEYSHGHSESSAGSDRSNEAEKTFAIIIGLLAGVALIIIFLTFIRKAMGGNGK